MSDEKPPQQPLAARHPDLEGYVSRAQVSASRPRFLPEWVPYTKAEWTRWRINTRLWAHFHLRINAQKVGGAAFVMFLSWCFVCWLDDISPYFAISEDPNTAFQHPHWVQQANARTTRERELKQRVQSSGVHASALDHATRAYSSNSASDRLS